MVNDHPSSDDYEDFFRAGDKYGLIWGEPDRLAKLVKDYPNKMGPLLDHLYDARLRLAGWPLPLARGASRLPSRKVLIIGVEVESRPEWMAGLRQELSSSRHSVVFESKPVAGIMRMRNLNLLLERQPVGEFDWLIVTDDDVSLPHGFLDRFIFLLDHFGFVLGQPAHTFTSHLTFDVNWRKWGSLARETGYVEVGPLLAMHRSIFDDMLPFPEIGMGYGVDVHWSYLARTKGWRIGVIDALPVRHRRPIATTYNAEEMAAAARAFLAARGGISRRAALRTLRTYRSLKGAKGLTHAWDSRGPAQLGPLAQAQSEPTRG